MKKMILAAFTALSLTAAIAPLASAASVHSGPYDNTANSLGGRNAGTYGGRLTPTTETASRPGHPRPFCVRPAWALSCGCKSRRKLVTVSEARRQMTGDIDMCATHRPDRSSRRTDTIQPWIRPRSRRLPVLTAQVVPSDKSCDLAVRLATSAGAPPRESSRRKSDRWTATRLIEPSARTSTTRQPLPVFRIT